jgi:hypothetical protein
MTKQWYTNPRQEDQPQISDELTGKTVCVVMDSGKDAIENARLIAAAPDLYAALQELLNTSELNSDEMEPETYGAMQQARAALAKVNQ